MRTQVKEEERTVMVMMQDIIRWLNLADSGELFTEREHYEEQEEYVTERNYEELEERGYE